MIAYIRHLFFKYFHSRENVICEQFPSPCALVSVRDVLNIPDKEVINAFLRNKWRIYQGATLSTVLCTLFDLGHAPHPRDILYYRNINKSLGNFLKNEGKENDWIVIMMIPETKTWHAIPFKNGKHAGQYMDHNFTDNFGFMMTHRQISVAIPVKKHNPFTNRFIQPLPQYSGALRRGYIRE